VDDPVVMVERTRNMIGAVRDAGGQAKYFEYFGVGHGSWDRAYGEPELLPWMFAQRLGQPDSYALKTRAPELPPVARFPADAEFPGQGPVRKMDWFRTLWIQRRIGWWLDREKDQGAVVFLGDSITQGWGSLANDFPGMKIANRGISGDVTRGVLCRMKEDVLDLNPKAVVLLIGTNDLEENGEPEVIADNVRAILAACARHHSRMPVVVCKVMPSHESKKRPANQIQRINELVDEIVRANPQYIRCDTYSIFANDHGDAKQEEFPDLLHPNRAGYAKWAAALRPILAELRLTER
jgi:lysophospholipase L1-like esterase